MKHTNKNHKRRNNKKRQTKKCNRGAGPFGDLFSRFSSNNNNTSTPSGNSTDLNKEAKDLFDELNTNKEDNILDETEYKNIGASSPLKFLPFKTVAGDDDQIDVHEFTTAYYFAKVNVDGDETLNEGEYATLRGLLPGAEKIEFKVVAQGDDKIEFNELLPLYYFLKASGPDANIDSTEYNKVKEILPGAAKIPYEQVDKNGNGIEFDEFLPLYYFARVNADGDDTLSADEYGKAKLMLENMKKMPDFGEVDADQSGTINFNEFLAAYNKPLTGGRRRRKRSTRNKRKSNKKRRTVKRRKSAKRSRRRK
jgi:hypothetical protein